MKIKCLLLSLGLFSSVAMQAQDKEIGGILGVSMYQGDLTKSQVTLGETNILIGGIYRQYINPKLNFKGAINFGMISGDDQNYSDDRDRYKRNLNFKSHILEFTAQMEYNLRPYIARSRRFRFAPYVFAGLSGFNWAPKTTLDGNSYSLRKYQTEGVSYGSFAFAIPYGFGLKYSLNRYLNLGFEIGHRLTFTDYLDDVSDTYAPTSSFTDPLGARLSNKTNELPEFKTRPTTKLAGSKRGDPDDNDAYIFMGVTLTKTFRRFNCNF